MKTVAVEQGLSNVKEYLQSQGCQCVDMPNAEASANGAACCVVSGGDKNFMGMQDITTDVPVVSAEGLSPEQVYQRVQNYIQ